MAGKSTYIRQTALLTLLAHTGSFIPADRATIGLIDRLFTRIGADDALHAGQSTFMVEMIETANILNHATPHSLVILDEIGRGTSTLDGLSLAWAIVEHLASSPVPSHPTSDIPHPTSGPRTLFATHYHELTDLEERLPGRVTNLHVAVREWPGGDAHAEIVFLHRILPGRTDQSYGLHVARLAGIPASVVSRGREVLASLAVHTHGAASTFPINAPTSTTAKPDTRKVPKARPIDEDGQMPLFTQYINHPALAALKEVKLDSLTPLQAFDALRRLKETAEQG
jgi:DNA mismatch repair protein MutS